ncbi:hypothetical protein ScPMuIL_010447 [Solemya velum]
MKWKWMQYLMYPDEVFDTVKLRFGYGNVLKTQRDTTKLNKNIQKCYERLWYTIGSYSLFIKAMDVEIGSLIAVLTTIFRAVDTIEDDTGLSIEERKRMLREFPKYLDNPSWDYQDCKAKQADVLRNFKDISAAYRSFPIEYQELLGHLAKDFSQKIAHYLSKDIHDIHEWHEYHSIIGGDVAVAVGMLAEKQGCEPGLLDDMHSGLKKAASWNMEITSLKDFHEDIAQGTLKWPTSIVSKYCKHPSELLDEKNREAAILCSNEIITECFYIPEFINYFGNIKTPELFHFCAVPVAFGIVFAEMIYGTDLPYQRVRRIRVGTISKVTLACHDYKGFLSVFYYYISKIYNKISDSDPNGARMRGYCEEALRACKTDRVFNPDSSHTASAAMVIAPVMLGAWALT